MNRLNKKQSGFTIIELMISTTIFSLILILCLAGILQITKMYYRSVTQNKTREVARTITDEIGEAIRFTSQSIQKGNSVNGPLVSVDDEDTGYFCIGQKRYTYAIDRQVNKSSTLGPRQKKHALWVDKEGDCSGPVDLDNDIPSPEGKDMVSENMRLYKLSVDEVSAIDSNNKLYKISVGVAYGGNDLLMPRPEKDPTELTCEGAFIGAEFCATTNLSVTVQKRL